MPSVVYTKEEIDAILANIQEQLNQIPALQAQINALAAQLAAKADKDYVDAEVANLQAQIDALNPNKPVSITASANPAVGTAPFNSIISGSVLDKNNAGVPNINLAVKRSGITVATTISGTTGTYSSNLTFNTPGTDTISVTDGTVSSPNITVTVNAPPPPPPPKPTSGIHVPMYIYPGTTGYTQWQRLAAAIVNAGIQETSFVVMNPNNGIFSGADANFTKARNLMKTNGIRCLGYVYTDYGARPIADVKANITNYKNVYGVDGIMFDEMSNSTASIQYYKDLGTFVASQGMSISVGNPGVAVPAGYIGSLSMIKVYEAAGYPPISTIQNRTQGAPKSAWGVTLHSLTTLDTNWVKQAAQYAQYCYLTNDSGSNPYDTLPTWLEQLCATLATVTN